MSTSMRVVVLCLNRMCFINVSSSAWIPIVPRALRLKSSSVFVSKQSKSSQTCILAQELFGRLRYSTQELHRGIELQCKAVPVYQYSCIRYISTDDLRITDLIIRIDHACVNRQNPGRPRCARCCCDFTRTSMPGASHVHLL